MLASTYTMLNVPLYSQVAVVGVASCWLVHLVAALDMFEIFAPAMVTLWLLMKPCAGRFTVTVPLL